MELGQKSVKNLVGFLEDLTTSKFHSDINRPLASHLLLELKTKVYFHKLVIIRLSLFHIWSKNEYIRVDIEAFFKSCRGGGSRCAGFAVKH